MNITKDDPKLLAYLLKEELEPADLAAIENSQGVDPEVHEEMEEIQDMIESLSEALSPAPLSSDLTLEQKTEVYALFSDIFPQKKRNALQSLLDIKMILALCCAIGIIVLIPFINVFTRPNVDDTPPKQINDGAHRPDFEIFEPPPPPPIKKEEKPRDDELKLEPKVPILETGPITGNGIPIAPTLPPIELEAVIDDVIDIINLDVRPRVITQVSPIYPPEQKRQRIKGEVLLEFIIDVDGDVIDAKVLKSDHQAFNRPALAAIRRWKFTPGELNGKVVKVRARLPLVFNVD